MQFGATPLNTFLWRHIARTPEGLLIGYFSIIANDPEKTIRFDYVPQNEHLLEEYKGYRSAQAIEWFSESFWRASKKDNAVIILDLRFGEFRFDENDLPEEWQFVFSWAITVKPESLIRQSPRIRNSNAALAILWGRLTGTIS